MKKKDIIDISSLSNDSQFIIRAMFDGKDSECAIIGASYIDKCLYNLLYNNIPLGDKKFIEDILFQVDQGPLGNYSARNKICYALKLFNEEIYKEIKNIGCIRNRFAHNYLVANFSDSDVIKFCNKLMLWERRFPPFEVKKINDLKPNLSNEISRKIFIYSSITVIEEILTKGLINRVLGEDYY